MSYMNQKQKEQ
jgi:hypothetical protein